MARLSRYLLVFLALLLVVQATLKVVRADDYDDLDDDEDSDLAAGGDYPPGEDDDFGVGDEGAGDFGDDDGGFPEGEGEFPEGEDDFGGDEGGEPIEEEEDDKIPEGDDGDVVALTDETFPVYLKEKPFMLVEFYAPWCGHCKALAPEWRKAATALKEFDVVVAKVDATKYEKLATENQVNGFPTIVFSENGVVSPFGGGRTSDDIVSWVKKKIGFAVTSLKTAEDATPFLDSDLSVVVALVESLEGGSAKIFSDVAKAVDGVEFVQTTDKAIAAKFGLSASKAPAFAVVKKETEKFVAFDGVLDVESLKQFVLGNRLPLIVPFNEKTAEIIFGGEIKKHIIFFAPWDSYPTSSPVVAAAATAFKGQLVFVYINGTDEDAESVREFFGIDSGNKTAVMGFFMPTEQDGKKYLMDGELTEANLKAFAQSIVDGSAKPYFKSEPVPEKNDGDVKVVVANSFADIVFDKTKDVLLEVYAPWCGHCKNLEPIYNKLGKKFSTVESVVISKMDGTANEYPGVDVEGFPTLFFYPANDKENPLKVEVDHKVKAFVKFIKKHASIPFTLPKTQKSVEEKAEDAELKLGDGDEAKESVRDEL